MKERRDRDRFSISSPYLKDMSVSNTATTCHEGLPGGAGPLGPCAGAGTGAGRIKLDCQMKELKAVQLE
jgi:hypothetical protein